MRYNIPYLIVGLIVTAGIPLGMLYAAMKWAEKNEKKNK
jgi:hypothetical protein